MSFTVVNRSAAAEKRSDWSGGRMEVSVNSRQQFAPSIQNDYRKVAMWNQMEVSLQSERNEPSAYYNNLISEMYDTSWYGAIKDAEVQYYAAMMTGKPALEFPTGTGRLAIPLLKAGIDLYGFDNSTGMLALLKDKLKEHCLENHEHRFVHWGALNTPFPCAPKSFAVVAIAFASFSLMHSNVASPIAENRVFREANRILEQGGKLVINDYRTGKIDFEAIKQKQIFNHTQRHPIHGDILEEQISTFKIEPNALIANQVVRYRHNRLVRVSDGVVLSESAEVTPIWDVDGFKLLGEDAGFEYVKGEVVDFYQDQTINHVFRKERDI
jgi:ubiquinone/menaquinone biosynthesis C-methylase UbiE